VLLLPLLLLLPLAMRTPSLFAGSPLPPPQATTSNSSGSGTRFRRERPDQFNEYGTANSRRIDPKSVTPHESRASL